VLWVASLRGGPNDLFRTLAGLICCKRAKRTDREAPLTPSDPHLGDKHLLPGRLNPCPEPRQDGDDMKYRSVHGLAASSTRFVSAGIDHSSYRSDGEAMGSKWKVNKGNIRQFDARRRLRMSW
jgi:hypothetical protein